MIKKYIRKIETIPMLISYHTCLFPWLMSILCIVIYENQNKNKKHGIFSDVKRANPPMNNNALQIYEDLRACMFARIAGSHIVADETKLKPQSTGLRKMQSSNMVYSGNQLIGVYAPVHYGASERNKDEQHCLIPVSLEGGSNDVEGNSMLQLNEEHYYEVISVDKHDRNVQQKKELSHQFITLLAALIGCSFGMCCFSLFLCIGACLMFIYITMR
ncbi:hypothetical protein THOM_0619 [Trachipleistophora hominis]|uniref:Uncharacterized protein n=1 Tax=Trachipleistophora hominis TaxID=72359 RepID=L7JY77_TRAHO|nr:hypothetical protein THOM_0619 [Trachipleistophora hominis]